VSLLFLVIKDGGHACLFVWALINLGFCYLFEQNLFVNFSRLL